MQERRTLGYRWSFVFPLVTADLPLKGRWANAGSRTVCIARSLKRPGSGVFTPFGVSDSYLPQLTA